MANRVNNKRYNKLLSYRNNYYGFGDSMNKLYNTIAGNPDKDGNITTGLFKGMSGASANLLGAASQAVGGAVGSAIGGGLESGVGNAIGGLSNIASAIPGPWGAVAGAGLNVVGGLVNRAFGSKMNQENINATNATIDKLNNFQSDASSFDTLADTWGSTAMGTNFSRDYIGKDGWFSNKAKKKARQLREKMELANAFVENSLQNNADNLTETTMNNLEANYAAFGGDLGTAGADFPTGLIFIDNGGTHESNPYEGVPMGIGDNGKPNLVEEGEAIYNDYVFSNRLTVPKAVRSKYKLRGNKELTFADAVKQLSKGATERPNDPISQDTLHEIMSDLAQTQEGVRETQNASNGYSRGGLLGNLYEGDGPGRQVLNRDNTPLDLGTSNESLRYAPAVGLGLASITDAMGLTNKPDYSEASMIEAATRGGSYMPVSWNPIGNKLTYRPFDRNYYTNKLNAEAGATRRAIANQSGGNSGRAIAGLLAADYNAQDKLGDLFRKAEEYNLEQRQKVEDFNRATNQANSQGMLQADMANQNAYANARDFSLRGTMAAAEMRQKARLAAEQAKSANLSGFLQALGDIGYENKGMNMIRRLAETGALGAISEGHPLYRYLTASKGKSKSKSSTKKDK